MNDQINLSLARLRYEAAAAKVWAIYAQRVVAGVLPQDARVQVYEFLQSLRASHPADDRAYCDAYEAHVKRTFSIPLRAVK